MEQEVDRIIDSQDNEYVLSRPKCALRQAVRSAGCGCCMRYLAVERSVACADGEVQVTRLCLVRSPLFFIC